MSVERTLRDLGILSHVEEFITEAGKFLGNPSHPVDALWHTGVAVTSSLAQALKEERVNRPQCDDVDPHRCRSCRADLRRTLCHCGAHDSSTHCGACGAEVAA